MQLIDQKRITLLSLMGMAEGTLSERYESATRTVGRLEDDGWFGGSGNSPRPSGSSQKQSSSSPSSDDPARHKKWVQRVLDLDDTQDVDALEAMTIEELKDLRNELK